MRFFTDNNVPDSVGNALLAAGHEVLRLRDAMPADSSDDVVAVACADNGYILVSHDQDFAAIAKRLNLSQRKHRQLHRIELRCPEPKSAARLACLLDLIELEWTRVSATAGQQLVVRIAEKHVRLER